MLRYLDYHLVYLGVFFFGGTLVLALMLKSAWPIGACTVAMQLPLITRSVDKRRHPHWRLYVLVNELLVFLLAAATVMISTLVQG